MKRISYEIEKISYEIFVIFPARIRFSIKKTTKKGTITG
jgi:hypothetical protein